MNETPTPGPDGAWRVAGLFVYPVKGLGGVALASARVEPWGLEGDRRWMVVDEEGVFLTQRQLPALAALRAAPLPGGLALHDREGATLDVETPGPGAARIETRVWRDAVTPRLAASRAHAWLSLRLGRACRLVHMDDPGTARPVDLEFGRPEDRVSFADGFPLLVSSEASLRDLNRRLETQNPPEAAVPMSRFRANVVVAGGEAWVEDGWARLAIGAVPCRAVKPCGRCVVTTIDQDTGETNEATEPLRTLGTFRRNTRGKIVFGQNVVPDGTGRIAVGDPVRPLS